MINTILKKVLIIFLRLFLLFSINNSYSLSFFTSYSKFLLKNIFSNLRYFLLNLINCLYSYNSSFISKDIIVLIINIVLKTVLIFFIIIDKKVIIIVITFFQFIL